MPPRRTQTIRQVIKESEPIVEEKLAPTRSKKVKVNNSDNESENRVPKSNRKNQIQAAEKKSKTKQTKSNGGKKNLEPQTTPLTKFQEKHSSEESEQVQGQTLKNREGSPELLSTNKKARTKSEKIQAKINAKRKTIQNRKEEDNKQQEDCKPIENTICEKQQEKDQLSTNAQNTNQKCQDDLLNQKQQPETSDFNKSENQDDNQQLKSSLQNNPAKKSPTKIVDIVFCCDTTASMGSYLVETKNAVLQFVKKIKEPESALDVNVSFGFVCYRDHPPQEISYLTLTKDLCNEDEIQQFIEQQNARGGGDAPEAVLDGLYQAANAITWREEKDKQNLRYIVHIADQPPHGKEFGIKSDWDEGVPTGITLEKVAQEINGKNIRYKLIKANRTHTLDKMVKLFKESFKSFEETNLQDATQLNSSINNIILKDLLIE